MALNCKKELPSGVVMNYHRVTEAVTNYQTGQVTVKVASYLDEAARRADKEPVQVNQHQLTLDNLAADPRVAFYEAAMQVPEVPEPVFMSDGVTPVPTPPGPNHHLHWTFRGAKSC